MSQKIIVVATPTSPLLAHVLHALQHESGLKFTALTSQTSISVAASASELHSYNGFAHERHHTSEADHVQTDFSESELQTHLEGSDLYILGPLVDAAAAAAVKLFIPAEYGLDTSNPKIGELLPPYQTRLEIQEKLRASGMNWKTIYSGIGLEEAMKTDGVLGVDALWASVVVFSGSDSSEVAISSYSAVARSIIGAIGGAGKKEGNDLYTCGFRCTLDEVIAVVEKELEKDVDRYEGSLEGARKEAAERMKMGYFDGGVALMGRVAVWDQSIGTWEAWKDQRGKDAEKREAELRKVVRQVRSGAIRGDGCEC